MSLNDPVTRSKAWVRRIRTIRTATRNTLRPADCQSTFFDQVVKTWRQASPGHDFAAQAKALWEIEHESELFLKTHPGDGTLNDPRLPPPLLPIAHVGAGMAAVERVGFHPKSLRREVHSFSHPSYRSFCFESLGAFLALYKKDTFRMVGHLQARLGMVSMMDLNRPDPEDFVAEFSASHRRLIAHGYGRMLYFKCCDLEAALRSVLKFSPGYRSDLVRGIAFAYTFVNHLDLGRILGVGSHLEVTGWRLAFEKGQRNLLAFWEWHYPGLLNRVSDVSHCGSKLLSAAALQHRGDRERGVPRAFTAN